MRVTQIVVPVALAGCTSAEAPARDAEAGIPVDGAQADTGSGDSAPTDRSGEVGVTCECGEDTPLARKAEEFWLSGNLVFVGSHDGAFAPADPVVTSARWGGCDAHSVAEAQTVELEVADALGGSAPTTVTAVAAAGAYYWGTETGEPHPSPPPGAPPYLHCLDDAHDHRFGSPETRYVYFLLQWEGRWFMDWRAEVVGDLVDSSGTSDASGPAAADVPLDALRAEASPRAMTEWAALRVTVL